jgi:serine acetyltransferase
VISPGAQVLGRAVLENGAFLGANATVYLGRRVGAGALVGAGSFLLTNLDSGKSAIGVPASTFATGGATGAGICTNQESNKKLTGSGQNE